MPYNHELIHQIRSDFVGRNPQWRIGVDSGDINSHRQRKDAICDFSLFPLFLLLLFCDSCWKNPQITTELLSSQSKLMRRIWDSWGQTPSEVDMKIESGNISSMHSSSNHMILGANWTMIEDLQGSCHCPLPLYITVFLRFLHQLMLPILNTLIISSILLTFSTVTMEFLNINDTPSSGGRNHVDPATLSADELLELCLVGTLLTDKPVKFTVMRDCLANLWRPDQKLTVSAIEANKFLFQFYHLWDMKKVIQGGPWMFNGHMLVLKKLAIGDEPLAVKLDELEMWVQIYNLPFGYINDPMGLLIGSHIGRFVEYDAYSNSGSWRMYMRIRVAVKVDEPLKRSLTFEKEDGGIVHVYFKYENLGVFCFVCGVLGHTEKSCLKRHEPDFVEGEKGWGNFLKSGNSSIGGGVTVNKWLYDGKGQSSGGRSGGNSANFGTSDRRTTSGTTAVGINAGQPVQHARFGRVKVIRDVRGKGFIFQTATASPMQQVAAYDGAVQWVPFVINFETLARPLINSAMGQQAFLERSNNNIHGLQAAAAKNTPNNSALVSKPTKSSAAATLTIGSTSKSDLVIAPTAVVSKTQAVNHAASVSGTKAVPVPKKRMRIAQGGSEIDAEVEEMTANTTHVEATTTNLQKTEMTYVDKKGAGIDIAVHTNPLFDVDVVMAGTGHQACQNK